jgi:23S rRNA-/tRNA-specific pseudouridylate synthase
MGHPILGDVKYLPAGRQVAHEWQDRKSIALVASAITFKSATDNKTINLEIPLPEGWSRLMRDPAVAGKKHL